MSTSTIRPFEGLCALVADDDLAFRDVVVEVLQADGFEVIAVADGDGLLRALECAARGLMRCDLVVTDLVMPRMGAFEVLARTARWAERPPVVVTTAYAEPGTEQRTRALGAIGPVSKPFDLADLRMIVWNAVRPVPA
ncbi:MAG: response regulator [Myxococcota bacterium]|nr:response regulator [Myxococcota bacterium]